MARKAKVTRTSKPRGYRPPYKLVEIIWDDASSNSETWVAVKDITEPEQVITVGFLVKETDKFVSVATSVSNEDLDEDVVGNTMTIPLGMIVSRRDIVAKTAIKKKPRAKKVEEVKDAA